MNLNGKKILIGITGSIAAYKMPLLVRELKKQGADIRVICTSDALNFVTAPTLATVSGNPVYTQFFKNDQTYLQLKYSCHLPVWQEYRYVELSKPLCGWKQEHCLPQHSPL